MNFSVIIPVAFNDQGWKELIYYLTFLSANDECLFVSPQDFSAELNELVQKSSLKCVVRFIHSESGRAKQQNLGSRQANNEFLWFLHCDSKISHNSFEKLIRSLEKSKNSLMYFDLKFDSKGVSLLKFNEYGVMFRSRLLGLPFGDQGFCLKNTIFKMLGSFDENTSYGEDHLLVWSAHQQKIKVTPVKAHIITSPRRYEKTGWAKMTFIHLFLTFKQAIPQFYVTIKILINEKRL